MPVIEVIEHSLIALIAGLVAIVVWEALGLREWTSKGVRKLQNRKIWKNGLALKGDVFLAMSVIPSPEGTPGFREADGATADLLKGKLLPENPLRIDPGLSPSHAFANVVLIGSTKYTERARDLQHWYDLPYQYIFEYFHADPPKPLLKIVSAEGQEYTSWKDIGRRPDPWFVDYGLLFVAAVPERKRIYWFSGIHGPGSEGVALYFTDHPEEFLVHESTDTTWARQWLFRVEYDATVSESLPHEKVKSVRVIGGPLPCAPRQSRRKIRAVICDFGNVLMTFDRERTYRALGHAYGKPYKDVESALKKHGVIPDGSNWKTDSLLTRYERGDIGDQEFFESVRAVLGAKEHLDLEAFTEWWGDIFWENRDVVQLFRELQKQVALVMLSNTNSLHMANVKEHYADVLNIFRGRVLSYEQKSLKPDPALFYRAMAIAGSDVNPTECIYIDDIAPYVEAAEQLGMLGHVYGTYPELVRTLRSVGLRIT